ncbi:hypothetical protein J7W19_00910 [Streptomyces mobaraensis NBRC 13819 = DSM 40847]|uniref:hypothetical protein n=1 Tax=Streptomyces mobaraensis TaxID=35621 RepID=UPI0003452AAC|nr:hypothetical protein [Streptomyces mobaraensis]QTT72183.1 hypothetical protein J7W19_00910 [Streptomyces mobaraensis NBRC 13819 = DSM 40847]
MPTAPKAADPGGHCPRPGGGRHPYGREERSRFLPRPVWRRLWAVALPWMLRRYRKS